LESIKYAENKLGKKMPTPKVLPKEHANAPVKYDIEEMSQKDIKATHKEISKIDEDKGNDAGDCELDDEECKARSVALVKKPLESEKLQLHSRMRHRHHHKKDAKDIKVGIKLSNDEDKKEDKEKAKK